MYVYLQKGSFPNPISAHCSYVYHQKQLTYVGMTTYVSTLYHLHHILQYALHKMGLLPNICYHFNQLVVTD